MALKVRRDGMLEDVSFIDAGLIGDEKTKRLALQTVREGGSFSAFPEELNSESELFDVRVKFKR
ncbi:MAG: hypothetical protein GY862_00730 [Gammaproteobacteria bacterium]|nr:hypothetical protein [Gammaproteobacteria bacterium]